MKHKLQLLLFFLTLQFGYNLSFSQIKVYSSSIDSLSVKEQKKNNRYYNFSEYSGIEFGFGGSYLFDKEINEDLNLGINGGMRLRFDLPNDKISLSPLGHIRSYSTPIENNSSVKNTLTIFKAGLQLSVRLYISNDSKLSVWNFFEINNSWVSNNYTWKVQSYNFMNNQNETSTAKENIFKGKSIASMIGYRLRYGIFFFETGYDLYSSPMKLSNSLIEYYESENISYDPNPKFSANALNFNFGISVKFDQMRGGGFGNFMYMP